MHLIVIFFIPLDETKQVKFKEYLPAYSSLLLTMEIFLTNTCRTEQWQPATNPQIFQRNRKVHLTNCLETNIHAISNISLRVIRCRNYS